jgi:hypothetical protein
MEFSSSLLPKIDFSLRAAAAHTATALERTIQLNNLTK